MAEPEDFVENTYSMAEDEVKLDELKEVSDEAQTNFQLPIKPPMTVVSFFAVSSTLMLMFSHSKSTPQICTHCAKVG